MRSADAREPRAAADDDDPLRTTPLDALHRAHGAKMCRSPATRCRCRTRRHPRGPPGAHAAALFDVSQHGQIRLAGGAARPSRRWCRWTSGPRVAPAAHAFFTNDAGGIRADLMVTRRDDDLLVVVNAGTKEATRVASRSIGDRCRRADVRSRARRAARPRCCGRRDAARPELASPSHDRLRGDDRRRRAMRRVRLHRQDGASRSAAPAKMARRSPPPCWPTRGRPRGLGAATRCGSRRASASTATTSTPRRRRRSRPDGDPEGLRPGGERAGGYPGAEVVAAQLAGGPPRVRVGLGRQRPRAGARRRRVAMRGRESAA